LPIFDELFPPLFQQRRYSATDESDEDLTPGRSPMLAKALRQFSEHLRQMLEKLLRGEN